MKRRATVPCLCAALAVAWPAAHGAGAQLHPPRGGVAGADTVSGPAALASASASLPFPGLLSPWSVPWFSRDPWRVPAGADVGARLAAASAAAGSAPGRATVLDSWLAAAGLPPEWGARADLDLDVRGRAQLGGAWDRVRPCVAVSTLRCDTGLPRVTPELDLVARANGTILDRLHVQVDYDRAREFGAANDVRLFWQGAAGEPVQRVEAGNVAFVLPPSRVLSVGLPGSNFGVRAVGRAGRFQLQGLWAQSRVESAAREFRLGGDGGGAMQEVRTSADDAEYVRGQFIFLMDPALLPGHPHLDVRALRASDAPAELVPARGIQLYRYTGAPPAQDGSSVLLRAAPHDPDREHEAVAGAFQLLRDGADYHLHSSGVWLVLARPLGEDEALGVAYRTAAGTVVGDLADGGAPVRQIRLLKGVRQTHQPGSATWPLEMRHVYRLAGSGDIDPASVRVSISLGDSAGGDLQRPHPAGGAPVSFLRLFGLDEDAPAGQVDVRHLYRPAGEGADSAFGGTYLVFPTLRPFAEPPPVPAAGLLAERAREVLGRDSSAGIYSGADARARREARRFRLNLSYAVRTRGMQSVVALGTAGIKQGSERVYLDGRPLERGTDYELRHETGELELRNPVLLAGGGDLRVTFEQDPLFQSAPVSVAGLSATYSLGAAGEVTLFGISQRERSLLRRPALGQEPSSLLVGGISGRAAFQAPWLAHALRWMGPRADTLRTEVVVSGELVGGMAGQGPGGAAYLDDFEQSEEMAVPMGRQAWRLGSAPASSAGLESLIPVADAASTATLVWQHDYRREDGRTGGSVRTAEVDTLIRSTARGLAGSVLTLSFSPTAGGTGAGWRAITAVLSPTGTDLRDHEYLEFYARGADAPGAALVIDLGAVSEDALATDAAGADAGTDGRGQPWGRGVLDQEWDPAREPWIPSVHDQAGLWTSACAASPAATYPLGDARANCTRGNGVQDTEDLNGNGVLDTAEGVLRYVVQLGGPGSPWLARGPEQTGTGYRLYRIPLRAGLPVGASPTALHHVRHVRLLLAGRGELVTEITRMRFVGSRWRKRGGGGIVRGLIGGDTAAVGGGELEIAPVSRVSAGAAYVSPPGIHDERQNPRDEFGAFGGVEYNEKSLSLRYRDLAPGDRAEAILPFEGRRRNLLGYRTLRFWAAAAGGGGGGEQLVLRVGSDPENYYLYRHRLAGPGRIASPADWGPEVVVELPRWTELRAAAEAALQARAAGDPGPVVVWDADSAYAVVMTDRGRAPNLAAVGEVSVGIWNGGSGPAEGEVWVDDIRLGDAVRTPGAAGQVSVGIRRAGVFQLDLTYAMQSGYFRQFRQQASYEGRSALTLSSSWDAGRVLPAHWRIEAPLALQHQAAGTDPVFLAQSDVPVGSLADFRVPRTGSTRLALQVGRRAAPGGRPGLLDGVALQLAYESGGATGLYSTSRNANLKGGLRYRVEPGPRTLGLFPDSAGRRWPGLLGRMARAPLLRAITRSRLRWSPTVFTLGTDYADAVEERSRFESFLTAGAPAGAREEAVQRRLMQSLTVGFRPFPSLSADVAVRVGRDLLPNARQNSAAPEAIARERGRLGPIDVGRMYERSLHMALAWSPRLTSWLSGHAAVDSRFSTDANPFYLRARGLGGDTAQALVRSLNGQRDLRGRLTFSPPMLLRALRPASAAGAAGWLGRISRAVERGTAPVELNWSRGLRAVYDRSGTLPGTWAQMGVGGREDLLYAGGDTATSLAIQTRFRAASAVEPFPGMRVNVAYEHARSDGEGARSERSVTDRKWPEIELSWSGFPAGRLTAGAVSSLSLGGGISRQSRQSEDPASAAGSGTAETRLPLAVGMVVRGGLTMAYRGEWKLGSQETVLARTRTADRVQTLTATGPIRLPDFLRPDNRRVALTLSYTQSDRHECRLAAEAAACGAENQFLRVQDRLLRFQADTRIRELNVGVHGDYVARSSQIGQKEGSSNFRVGLFAQFELVSRPRTFPAPASP